VAHLPDGRVLSGGGDGKVCLWPARRGTQCFDLDGHASAVSKVQGVEDSHKLAWSAAYDGKVRRKQGTQNRADAGGTQEG
jgi:WD40 repeat protein